MSGALAYQPAGWNRLDPLSTYADAIRVRMRESIRWVQTMRSVHTGFKDRSQATVSRKATCRGNSKCACCSRIPASSPPRHRLCRAPARMPSSRRRRPRRLCCRCFHLQGQDQGIVPVTGGFARHGKRQFEMGNALAMVTTGACRGQQGRHNSRGDAAGAYDPAESPGMDGRDTGEGRVADPCVNVLSDEEPGDDGTPRTNIPSRIRRSRPPAKASTTTDIRGSKWFPFAGR